jgi:branched-chain amino acid transport system permease protein
MKFPLQMKQGVVIPLVAGLYLLGACFVSNQYYQLILTLIPIWAVMGCAWNIFSGYSGLVSFGHSAFFGIGAYTVGFLMIKGDVSPWLGIPAGMVAGAIGGALIGYPTFRLRGHYFALSMLAFPLTLIPILEWLGYREMTLPMKSASPAAYMQFSDHRYYIALAVGLLVASMYVCLHVSRSRLGLSLLAIKQNESAAQAVGIDVWRIKMKAIMVSGAMAAAAGGMYAVVLLVLTPGSVFGAMNSVHALVVCLFGGVATLWGPVIGAISLVPLSEIMNAQLGETLPGIEGVTYGLALLLVMFLAPEGILHKINDRLGRDMPKARRKLAAVVPVVKGNRRAKPADEVILSASQVSRHFGGLKAVQDVSFSVRQGEVLGIIGPNGAGKTTLFNLLNGFLQPSSGQVSFRGQSLTGLQIHEICKAGMGRTFQVVRPFPRLTVLENVVIGSFAATSGNAEATHQAYAALERVGLAHCANELAGGLTSVELRLMELARALATRPALLLLDEPFAGLGTHEVECVLSVINGLAEEGMTVAIIEHTMQAMVRLVDRLVVLDHGTVVAVGAPEQVTSKPEVIEAYLGKKWVALC